MTRSLMTLALVLASTSAMAGTVHEVPGDFATITGALAAASPTDTVRVAAGTFSPTANGESFPLSVPDGVVLLGEGMQVSVLDAEGTAGVVELAGPGAARVSGFTLTGGVAITGGGVQISAGTHEVDALLVIDCGALARGSAINAGGTAAPHVHHNVLWECYDTDLVHVGDPHVAHWGESATGTFEHNLVGRGDSNGLFVLESAAPEVRHNIFFDNGIDGVRGRGMCFAGGPTTIIAHNLFWENSVASLIMKNAEGAFEDVDAATANSISTTDGVYGNFDAAPMLTDPDNLDFTLAEASPAIDAGEPGTGTDPDGTLLDLGPFYHPMAVVGVPPAARPARADLGPARPNPFNPRTTLELTMQRTGFARVTVHDARGRQLRTLHSGTLAAGTRTLRFDGIDDRGRALASGVYFARLEALGEVDVTPMVLVR